MIPSCPPGCELPPNIPTKKQTKPWLNGAECTCPTNLTELPETKMKFDCRINDDDHDGAPGVTIVGRVPPYAPVDMYMVQRSRDQYLHLDHKSAQRPDVLLADFYTTRSSSLLGCPPPDDQGANCTSSSPSCPSRYSTAEFVRVASGQTFSCDGLYEAEATVGLFNEQTPANCEQ